MLFEKGYILNYKFEDNTIGGVIKIALKYHPITKLSAINEISRVSKPGSRQYTSSEDMPRVKNGLGIAIVTTSQGVMTDKEAKKQNVGGELICYVS